MTKKILFLTIAFVGLVFFNIALIVFLFSSETGNKILDFLNNTPSTELGNVHNEPQLTESSVDTFSKIFTDSVAAKTDYQPVSDEDILLRHVDYKLDTTIVRTNFIVPVPKNEIKLTVDIIYQIYPTPQSNELSAIVKNMNYAFGKKISSLDPAMMRPHIVSRQINQISQGNDSLLFNHLRLNEFNFNAEVLSIKIERLN